MGQRFNIATTRVTVATTGIIILRKPDRKLQCIKNVYFVEISKLISLIYPYTRKEKKYKLEAEGVSVLIKTTMEVMYKTSMDGSSWSVSYLIC